MDITTDFSARLAEMMAEKGLRQSDIATLIGVSQGTVSGWLNGAVPQSRTASVLCEKLGVSVDWLLGGVGEIRRGKVKLSDKVRLGIVEPLNLSQKRSIEFFAANLRAIRGKVGIPEFSKLVGLSKPEVYERYEKGKVPRPLIVQRIANRIGATVEELLTAIPEDRVASIQSQMQRVSQEVELSKRPLTHRTRLVFYQARQDLANEETRRFLTKALKLEEIPSEQLVRIYNHLEATTHTAPLEIGRYYYPLLDAVGMEFNRRSENSK